VVSSELGPIYRRTVIRAVAGLGEPTELSDGSGAPPLTTRFRRRHTKVALSAVRAHRGSKSSNPSPSSRESANFQSLSVMTPSLAARARCPAL